MESILFEKKDNIGLITFNRPKVFNSFNREMAFRMQDLLTKCEEDNDVRVILITGNGKAFCAGQDLAELMDPNGPELSKIVGEHYNPIVLKIRTIEKPIIAAVNGVAAGAGANIALACDICVATESASFIQAFSKIGLVPDSGGSYFLPRLIGFQKALAITMLGDKIGAKEAEKMGMIYQWFLDEEFLDESFTLASKLSKMPTKGLGMTKRAYNQGIHNDLETQLALENELQVVAGKTHDYNEGVQAFIEKRKPNFKGE